MVTPALNKAVVPVTLAVLTALFAVQRFGTAGIGRWFGPVTLLWFAVLVALGVPHIVAKPQVLAALNPAHATGFASEQRLIACAMWLPTPARTCPWAPKERRDRPGPPSSGFEDRVCQRFDVAPTGTPDSRR